MIYTLVILVAGFSLGGIIRWVESRVDCLWHPPKPMPRLKDRPRGK